jgi:hypothetical protein
MGENDKIREGFKRQRRNLMIVSVVLLFAQTSGITINKLNVFGNELEIPNPIVINRWLWVLWGYWLWRYYNFYHDMGGKGFARERHKVLNDLVPKYFFRKLLRNTIPLAYPNREGAKFYGVDIYGYRPFSYDLLVKIQFADDSIEGFKDVISLRNPEDRVPLILMNVRALVHIVLHTHLFSEYILPYILAALPLIYLLACRAA